MRNTLKTRSTTQLNQVIILRNNTEKKHTLTRFQRGWTSLVEITLREESTEKKKQNKEDGWSKFKSAHKCMSHLQCSFCKHEAESIRNYVVKIYSI
jgi:hypothetical protein